MDRVMATVEPRDKAAAEQVLEDLALVAPHYHWTAGTRDGLDMRRNDIQNVPRRTNELSSYLIRVCIQAKVAQR